MYKLIGVSPASISPSASDCFIDVVCLGGVQHHHHWSALSVGLVQKALEQKQDRSGRHEIAFADRLQKSSFVVELQRRRSGKCSLLHLRDRTRDVRRTTSDRIEARRIIDQCHSEEQTRIRRSLRRLRLQSIVRETISSLCRGLSSRDQFEAVGIVLSRWIDVVRGQSEPFLLSLSVVSPGSSLLFRLATPITIGMSSRRRQNTKANITPIIRWCKSKKQNCLRTSAFFFPVYGSGKCFTSSTTRTRRNSFVSDDSRQKGPSPFFSHLVFLSGSDRVPVFGWSQTLVREENESVDRDRCFLSLADDHPTKPFGWHSLTCQSHMLQHSRSADVFVPRDSPTKAHGSHRT